MVEFTKAGRSRMASKKKATTFVANYFPAMMNRASHLIAAEFHRVAQSHGFSVTEWRVMGALAEGKVYSTGELAELTLTKQPTLTRVLARMEARGEVARQDAPGDKRITLARLTPRGAKVAAKLVALAKAHEEQVLAQLGAAPAAELKRALRELIARLDKDDTLFISGFEPRE
jgi:DNA-binding MarR family transcriptional regulator